ncbi:PTS lichenan-specific IIA component domain protein [Mycoplasmoides gallisepticum str. F]|nr:PTS lichenan-specific IIA component domain protein [Mycoplasmoides gallisepticum str. F]
MYFRTHLRKSKSLKKSNYTKLVSLPNDAEFVQEKILNGFNHNVNYDLLNKLNFVPKFLGSDEKICKVRIYCK